MYSRGAAFIAFDFANPWLLLRGEHVSVLQGICCGMGRVYFDPRIVRYNSNLNQGALLFVWVS